MSDRDVMALVMSAENRWMQGWIAGPTIEGRPLRRGDSAPDVTLLGTDGSEVQLSSTWSENPALILLWRHLGCGCGRARAKRLIDEIDDYRAEGLEVIVVAPGDPERVGLYAERNRLAVTTLADSEYAAHKAFGLGHWSVEQVLYDAPAEYCEHGADVGAAFQARRRDEGNNLVDDPWMQSGEFLVDTGGTIRVAYLYNYCEDYPDARVFLTAARLAN
jgi:peroxiredoxin